MKKPAPRKPKDLRDLSDNYCYMNFFITSDTENDVNCYAINASLSITSSKQCRKYAAWLISAAEYLESKDSKKPVKTPKNLSRILKDKIDQRHKKTIDDAAARLEYY